MQEFVDGETFCTYSTVHDGQGHRPLRLRDPAPVEALDRDPVRRDRRRRDARGRRADRRATATTRARSRSTSSPRRTGRYLVECNPRATDGVLLMGSEQLAHGLLDPDAEARPCPPARRSSSTSRCSAGCSPTASARRRRRSATCSTSAAPTAAGTTRCRTSTRSSPLAHYERLQHDASTTRCSSRWPATSAGTASRSPGCPTPTRSCSARSGASGRATQLSTDRDRDPGGVDRDVERVRVAARDEALVDTRR